MNSSEFLNFDSSLKQILNKAPTIVYILFTRVVISYEGDEFHVTTFIALNVFMYGLASRTS